MPNLSRRTALATVAGAAATAVPIAAAAAPNGLEGHFSDPFLTALDAFRKANVELYAAFAATGALEDAADAIGDAGRDGPRIQWGTKTYRDNDGVWQTRPNWLTTDEQIDREVTEKKTNRELHEALAKDAAWLDAEQEKNGLKAARLSEEAALEKVHQRALAACYVAPTTMAGCIAFVRFLNDEMFFNEAGLHTGDEGERARKQSFATLERALSNFSLETAAS